MARAKASRASTAVLPDATLLFRVVLSLASLLRARMDAQLADIDVTTQQAAVLTLLEGLAAPPTQGELAALLGSTHQNVRQILDVLTRKGLVRVRADPADRRSRRIQMTPRVRELFGRRDARDHRAIRAWFGALTDKEVAQAARLLRKVLTEMRDTDPRVFQSLFEPVRARPVGKRHARARGG